MEIDLVGFSFGIGNFEKFELKNAPMSESSKTDFKDFTNKVFD